MGSVLNTLSCFDAGNKKLSYNIIHLLIGIVFDEKFNDKVEIIDGRLLQSHQSNGSSCFCLLYYIQALKRILYWTQNFAMIMW